MKVSQLLTSLTLSLLSGQALSNPVELQSRAAGFQYGGSTKVRGVNLGGWFVLEPWITPSLFDALNGRAVDEWTFCQTLGATEAKNRLTRHWNSFYTQNDFRAIASAGLNHVRIPIGYWSIAPIQGEPFVQGAYDKLREALGWAQSSGLKVMIDLHGAPGSQNGFDNSGRAGPIRWTQGNTIQQTKNAINKIKNDFASHPAVASIQLVNEPFGPSLNLDTIKSFYSDGAASLQNTGVWTAFHDAFAGVTNWNNWGNNFKNLVLDTHHYEVFNVDELRRTPQQHVEASCAFGRQMASTNKPTISGEWSGAFTDCTKYLNGYGKGARYDNTFQNGGYVGSCAPWKTGSIASLPAAQQVATRKFIEAQLDAYEKAAGWIFWTWKTEGAPGWDMSDLIKNGVFPQPLTNRRYAGQCG